jgi:hypothetical protein
LGRQVNIYRVKNRLVLGTLKNNWVTPKLSVGPSARHSFTSAEAAEARRRIAELVESGKKSVGSATGA